MPIGRRIIRQISFHPRILRSNFLSMKRIILRPKYVWHAADNFSINFYLPHMEYEESIGFVSRKMKKKIADFHVLRLFMAKKHDLSEKTFSVCHAPGRCR
jgi:hypothetical protein